MTETKNEPLPDSPTAGGLYRKVLMVNMNKHLEELVLLRLDVLEATEGVDQRWLAIGKTHLEQAFMAINRAVFKRRRIDLDDA
jgi:hypothetical protein